MRLSEFIEVEKNDLAERRRLAGEKSYEILDRLDGVGDRFADISGGDAVGSVSPSIFVGRAGYPEVSTGLLSPVGNESDAARFVTDGAWYATRLAVLKYLDSIDRQAKALVLRHVSEDYWGPVGGWQVREAVRHAFEGDHAVSETFDDAVAGIAEQLPVSLADLHRKSTLAAGRQTGLDAFR